MDKYHLDLDSSVQQTMLSQNMTVGVHDVPQQNMLLWYIDSFEL